MDILHRWQDSNSVPPKHKNEKLHLETTAQARWPIQKPVTTKARY
jgi:hypothetical protein